MSKVLVEKILNTEQLTRDLYKMTIKSDYISKSAMPGQFVNIRCLDHGDAILRRPISICNVDRKKKEVTIIFQVKGKGTKLLSAKSCGLDIDLVGPLGKPFNVSLKFKKIAIVGGGIGIFPLLFLVNENRHLQTTTFIGFRNKSNAVLVKEFCDASNRSFISTDDGSLGYKGIITDLFKKDIVQGSYDCIYTCGPKPMIKNVVDIATQYNIKCQVSLEQRMGCGIGACLVCACKTKKGDDWEYSHICKDGPVFWSNEIILE